MNRICKYNPNNFNNCYCNNKWDRLYYNLYGVGNVLNVLSKVHNIKKIISAINSFRF